MQLNVLHFNKPAKHVIRSPIVNPKIERAIDLDVCDDWMNNGMSLKETTASRPYRYYMDGEDFVLCEKRKSLFDTPIR